ncbi:MAG: glycosyltransferase [Eubacterium sp.]|nr:glycosyltransferase [Eubacterium sp.]
MSISNKDETSAGLSIIVPFLNEEEGITKFCDTIDEHATKITFPIEVVFVNDGSTDDTLNILRSYSFKNVNRVKAVDLSKNYGSHAAIRAGVSNAYYDNCTWMGSDLQEPIEFLAMSFEKLKEGFDAVYVEKKSVKVSSVNRGFSKIYSRMMQKYAVKSYSSGGISVIVFNKKIKELLNHNIESNSSIMLQIMDAGFRYTTLSLDFHERSAGVSKWTLSKKIKLFIDSFVAFSFMPIRMVSIIGIIMFCAGVLLGLFTFINKLVNPEVPIGYSTLACIMAMGFGITNISLGIIAEYLWRAYDAARKRPVFLVSEVYDLSDKMGE